MHLSLWAMLTKEHNKIDIFSLQLKAQHITNCVRQAGVLAV